LEKFYFSSITNANPFGVKILLFISNTSLSIFHQVFLILGWFFKLSAQLVFSQGGFVQEYFVYLFSGSPAKK